MHTNTNATRTRTRTRNRNRKEGREKERERVVRRVTEFRRKRTRTREPRTRRIHLFQDRWLFFLFLSFFLFFAQLNSTQLWSVLFWSGLSFWFYLLLLYFTWLSLFLSPFISALLSLCLSIYLSICSMLSISYFLFSTLSAHNLQYNLQFTIFLLSLFRFSISPQYSKYSTIQYNYAYIVHHTTPQHTSDTTPSYIKKVLLLLQSENWLVEWESERERERERDVERRKKERDEKVKVKVGKIQVDFDTHILHTRTNKVALFIQLCDF